MSNINKPVCLITGLGDGTGGFTARRFSNAGYKIAMIARTKERLIKFEKELPDLWKVTVKGFAAVGTKIWNFQKLSVLAFLGSKSAI
mgnify:CR=1 FL=1